MHLEGLTGIYKNFPMRQRCGLDRGVQKVFHMEKRPRGKIQKRRPALTCAALLACPDLEQSRQKTQSCRAPGAFSLIDS